MDFLGDEMKIKPLYIYLLVFIVFVGAVIFFSGNTKKAEPNSAMNGQMPSDDVHKGLKAKGNNEAPSANNVMEEAKQKLANLKKEVEANPDDTLKLKEYAVMLGGGHQPEEAIKMFEKILKKGPNRIDIMHALTFLYFNKGDLSKAEEYTNNVLSVDRNNKEANFNLGAIAATKGDKVKAKEIWNSVIKKFPNTDVAKLAQSALESLKNVN